MNTCKKTNFKNHLSKGTLYDDYLKKNHPDNIRRTMLKSLLKKNTHDYNNINNNIKEDIKENDESESENKNENNEKEKNSEDDELKKVLEIKILSII